MSEISNPSWYTTHPSGIECIDVVEHMSFNLGNAIKYLWRSGLKTEDYEKDLRKAIWYIEREIVRLSAKKQEVWEGDDAIPQYTLWAGWSGPPCSPEVIVEAHLQHGLCYRGPASGLDWTVVFEYRIVK